MKTLTALMLGSLVGAAVFAQAPPAPPAGGAAPPAAGVKIAAIEGKVDRKGPCGPTDRDLQPGDTVSLTCALISNDPDAIVQLECGNDANQVLSNQFVAVITAGGVPNCAIKLERGTAVASSSPEGGADGEASIDTGLLSANSTHTQFGVTVPPNDRANAEAFVLEGEASIKRGDETQTLSNGQMFYARTRTVEALPDAQLKLYANNFARVTTANASATVTVAARAKIADSYYATWKKPDDGNIRAALATELQTLAVAPSSLTRYQTVRAKRFIDKTTHVQPETTLNTNHLNTYAMGVNKTFAQPMSGNYRIDICLHWGVDCGQAAANKFCSNNGYSTASAFDYDKDVGAQTPTLVIGDNKVCNAPSCDAFRSITCR